MFKVGLTNFTKLIDSHLNSYHLYGSYIMIIGNETISILYIYLLFKLPHDFNNATKFSGIEYWVSNVNPEHGHYGSWLDNKNIFS